MVVTVYVDPSRGEAFSKKQFEEKVQAQVAYILEDSDERDAYLNDYLEIADFDRADCFQMSESRREDIRASFKKWLAVDVRESLLETHFDEYTVEV